MGFFKLWDGILDNIKVQRLTPELFRAWVNLIAVTVRYGGSRGELPSWDDMGFGLRTDRATLERWVRTLVTAGLIDHKNGRYLIHDFEKWNESKDKTAAKRQKEWRERNASRNALRNGVTETSHNTPQVLEGIEGIEGEKNTPLPPEGDEGGDESRGKREWDGIAESWVVSGPELPPPEPPAPKPRAKATRPKEWTDAHERVLNRNVERFGASNGELMISDLLKDFSPKIVAEACDEHFARDDGALDGRKLMGICRAMHEGRWKLHGNGKPAASAKPDNRRIFVAPPPRDPAMTVKLPPRTA